MSEKTISSLADITGITLRFQNVNVAPWKGEMGLMIVDVVRGFCEKDAGPLAPKTKDPAIDRMVRGCNEIARAFELKRQPIMALRDCHDEGQQEGNYSKHCLRGTPEAQLMPQLQWITQYPMGTVIDKNCTSAFVAGIQPDGTNSVVRWLNHNGIKKLLICGICTDICVMETVLALLSAKTRGMTKHLEDVLVPINACATYHMHGVHPRDFTEFFALYFMAQAGAILVNELTI